MITVERRRSLLLELEQIDELLIEVRYGYHKILSGEAQSYTINSIQINRRSYSLNDLEDLEKRLWNRKAEIEAELAGKVTPLTRTFLPVDF